MNNIVRNFFNGLAFGITETVPAVSAGTVAIILGFYDQLIDSINNFTKDCKKHLTFLLPIALGIATGILTFSSIINHLLTNYSFPTMMFFIGLISGIIPLIYSKTKDKDNKKYSFKEIIMTVIPFLILVLISNIKQPSTIVTSEIIKSIDMKYMFFILIAGIIAAAALVIPGISGSFVLLILGIYPVVNHSVSSIRFLLVDFTNIELFLQICKVLVPLAIGVAIGGLSMTRLIDLLLKKYYKITYLIILGLLFGSIYSLFKEPIVYQSGISTPIFIISIVSFFVGMIISLTLSKK